MRRIAYLPANVDACAAVRMFYPHLNSPNSHFIIAADGSGIPYSEFADADVCIVQRLATQLNAESIQTMKKMGMKVMYDLDDDLFSIPSYNPAYSLFRQYLVGIRACANLCDVITCSTVPLALAIRKNLNLRKGMKVFVIPNALDYDLFRPLPRQYRHKFVIGWGGSNTHSKDVGPVFEMLGEILKMFPHVYLEFVGTHTPESLADHPRVLTREFVPIAEYAAHLAAWRWDLFLAPLEDNRFNRSKSNLKMLEAAAVARPILASRVVPYKDFVHVCGKQYDELLCDTLGEWRRKIIAMIEDPERAARIGESLREAVIREYNIKTIIPKWIEAAEAACSTSS